MAKTTPKTADAIINASLKEFDKQLNAKIEAASKTIEQRLGDQVAQVIKDLTAQLGSGTAIDGLNAGLSNAALSAINGNGISVRGLANSFASAYAPQVSDFFKQSSSQMADSFSGFLGLSSRNN